VAPGAGDGPHVFVADVDAPELDPDDRHHLERVLRVRAGDPFTVADGRGRWRRCRFGPDVEPTGAVVVDAAPAPALTVAFALVKGERPELVVQKLTELGIDRIVAFRAARSVVRWDAAKAAKQIERLRRVAREAAMQSRRSWLPQVDDLATFEDALALPGAVAADRGGAPLSLATPTVLIGPEGGWAPEERARLHDPIGLGDQVLRAETAALAAGTLLGALRSGLVAPAATDHPGG
jgi:16S rRNA (uracil1498-N3)-methyltransferase